MKAQYPRMNEIKVPRFYYGPKDGAPVPELLWILDEIKFGEMTPKGLLVHKYVLNEEEKNYYYAGVARSEDDDEWN